MDDLLFRKEIAKKFFKVFVRAFGCLSAISLILLIIQLVAAKCNLAFNGNYLLLFSISIAATSIAFSLMFTGLKYNCALLKLTVIKKSQNKYGFYVINTIHFLFTLYMGFLYTMVVSNACP